ncbi:uncharacterized protein [Drosophila bipectinata]|uniref:uncharacterized protein n=1 Tax=Drosophila bipectinata TaxID=42026 RepID=UPI001C8A6597|nr:uncharacterized protein LOC108132238 [Drosophila bipectinata]
MDVVHTTIGVTSILALFLVVANSISQVSDVVAERTATPLCRALNYGSPMGDQLAAVEGITSLVESDGMDNACSMVQSIGGRARDIVGTFLPTLDCEGRLAASSGTGGEKSETQGEDKPAPESAPQPEADPPAED